MNADQRDAVAEAPSPHLLCPYWSRVAETPKGLLALCSYYDLEDQRKKGYGEPEGWVRLEKCQVDRTWGENTAKFLPYIALSRTSDGKAIHGWIAGTASPVEEALGKSDFDYAWELALDWVYEDE